jgi:broad specificity phosphatase PhoE
MTKILLVRHGHVEGIRPERFRGRADVPLTELGRAQAEALARHIAASWRPVHILTSPLRRCVATAAAIGEAGGLAAQTCDELCDIDYGRWQWKTFEEVKARAPDAFAAWFATPHLVRFPGGESLQDLVARTADALRRALAHRVDGTVVLVGHDSVNRALLLQLLDQPLSGYWRLAQDPCGLNEIDVVDGRILVRRINETAHLRHLDGAAG